ncbi:hypothetical protein SAICODRAFT_32264 [Saitoella complicata NRRL Y-17804]|nr:uncharacterized protein SAICODRAFT_32264 [Saitoella complicata NRRL Y-17804]ODQ49777.1 hypothetical protein SAICODRAFT_32264 [Saitoella complicata NRRL Y-17804]
MSSLASKLTKRTSLPPLCPTSVFDASLTGEIAQLPKKQNTFKSGLHVWNDNLHEAHEIAQSMDGEISADYWHAILHRREKDFWNSIWWLSRISHPVLIRTWDPTGNSLSTARREAKKFVDRVERLVVSGEADKEEKDELEKKQAEEMMALLEYCQRETT